MSKPRTDVYQPTVLWEAGPMSCTSRTLHDTDIEVCLLTDGVVTARNRFHDVESASAYAIDKMSFYRVP